MQLSRLRYNSQETAELLSVSIRTLMRRLEQGKILGAYKDGRHWYFSTEGIIEYINKYKL